MEIPVKIRLLLLAAILAIPSTGRVFPPEGSQESWIPLFNGRDLSWWHFRDPEGPNGWKVEDGVYINTPPSTDLQTDQDYSGISFIALRRLQVYIRLPQSSPPSTVFLPEGPTGLPATLLRVPKTHRLGIQNQLFQIPLHSCGISESFSWVPQARLSRREATAHLSVPACWQTAAASGGSPLTTTNNSGHA